VSIFIAQYCTISVEISTKAEIDRARARILCSFDLLTTELACGRSVGNPFAPSLQVVIPSVGCTIRDGPAIVEVEIASGDRLHDVSREGEPIQSPHPIQRLRLLAGENTPEVLGNNSLLAVNGCG